MLGVPIRPLSRRRKWLQYCGKQCKPPSVPSIVPHEFPLLFTPSQYIDCLQGLKYCIGDVSHMLWTLIPISSNEFWMQMSIDQPKGKGSDILRKLRYGYMSLVPIEKSMPLPWKFFTLGSSQATITDLTLKARKSFHQSLHQRYYLGSRRRSLVHLFTDTLKSSLCQEKKVYRHWKCLQPPYLRFYTRASD